MILLFVHQEQLLVLLFHRIYTLILELSDFFWLYCIWRKLYWNFWLYGHLWLCATSNIFTSKYEEELVSSNPHGYWWHETAGLVSRCWTMVWALGCIISLNDSFFLMNWVGFGMVMEVQTQPSDCIPCNHVQVITETFLRTQAKEMI